MAEKHRGYTGRHFLPAARYSTLSRQRLTDAALALNPAIIVFTGVAGAGKTTAARNLAISLADEGKDCLWVRITAREGGGEGFWSRVLLAFDAAGMLPGESLAARMLSGGLITSTTDLLVQAFAEVFTDRPRPCTLILDDLHHASTQVLEDLVEVVEQTEGLNVVATSRNALPEITGIDTRARLPVREISEQHLAFTEEETAELAGLRLPDLKPEDHRLIATEVQHEAQGWPIASHALIVERHDQPDPSHKTAPGAFIRSYVRRLIDRCPTEFHEALMASALLDEVSPAVLAAILDTDVCVAQEFFDTTDEASLTYWVDENGIRWYRFHHLIREALLNHANATLTPHRLKMLYRRAAKALRETHPRDAVQACIRAGAWDVLTDLLLEDPVRLIAWDRQQATEPWLRHIPAAARKRSPVLAAFSLFDQYATPGGRFHQVVSGMRMVVGNGLGSASLQPGLEGAVAAVLRMVAARLSGNEKLSLQMAERSEYALAQLTDEEIRPMTRSLATGYTQRAITYLHASRFDDAEHTLAALDPQNHDVQNLEISDYHWAHRASLLAFSLAWRGHMDQARQAVERCEEIGTPVGWHSAYIGTGYRLASALLALDQACAADQEERTTALNAAITHLRALDATSETTEHWPYLVETEAMVLGMRHSANYALTWLAEQLQRRQRLFSLLTTPKSSLQGLHAKLLWQAGHPGPKPARSQSSTLTAAYLALSRQESNRARAVLGRLLGSPALVAFPRRYAEGLLLNAKVSLDSGDTGSARSSALLATDLLEKHRLALPYQTLSQSDLAKLSELAPGIRPELGNNDSSVTLAAALTSGELRTLAAVAEHGTVTAAAKELYISPNTVKTQLKTVYRKLGVSERDEAISMAHRAGLLIPDSGWGELNWEEESPDQHLRRA